MGQEFIVGRGFGKLALTEAAEKAKENDIIYIEPGEYMINERLTLNGAQLIGIGRNANDVIIYGSIASSRSTQISKLTINCTFENNALWIGKNINMQVTECVIRGTQYPAVAVNNGTATFINCQLEHDTNGGLYILEQSVVKIVESVVQGLDITGKSTISIETCQLSHRIWATENSTVMGTDLYFTDPVWENAVWVESGSRVKIESVELVAGKTSLYSDHGLIQISADNTEEEHIVVSTQDDFSTIEFPGLEESSPETEQEQSESELIEEDEITNEDNDEEIEEILETDGSEVLAELYGMIGLSSVKETVQDMIEIQKMNRKLLEKGRPLLKQTLHSTFLGNPGTGKTTVARLIGRLMYEQGILPKDTFKEVSEQDLISPNMGETAEKTQAVLQSADGGVLFIDEAYSLYKENYGQQSQEAVDTILKYMEDHRDSMMIIFAGYTKQMQDFLDMNPGFRSRISNEFMFEDYTPDEVAEMGMMLLNKNQFKYDQDYYVTSIKKAYQRSIDQSNGRWVRNFNEKLGTIVVKRCVKEKSEAIDIIKNEDIAYLVDGDKVKKAAEVERLLKKLNSLIGLDEVKKYVANLVERVRIQEEMKDELPDESQPTYHMIFAGPPGTGKTTVANIISELFYNLGILPKKIVISTDRHELVGHYIGESEKNTTKILRNAMGGVLFVDEAYQLNQGGENDFGKQVIETMLPVLENDRDKFVAIFAGYTDEMEQFLRTNPGLKSRIPLRLNFAAYTPEQIGQIVELYLGNDWHYNHELVRKIASENYQMLAKSDQGNARWARTFTNELTEKHMLWVGQQTNLIDSLQIMDETIQSMSTIDGDGAESKDQIVQEVLTEIDGLTGMANVKTFIHNLVKQVQVNRNLAGELGEQSKPNYHMIFTGPAGTGKTTVARLIAKLFYGLDILPRKTVKEVTKTDLVDQYVGGNERKTQEAIDDAMGGVLFIDEAYQLASEQGNGNAVIDTLLTNLENHRSEFIAIFAGYTEEMNRFLDMNEGLRSRIPLTLEFENYTSEEIGIIADNNLMSNWMYNHELLQKVAAENYQMVPKKEQGNARWARTFTEQVIQKQKRWLAEQIDVQSPRQIADEIIQSMSMVAGDGAESKEQVVQDVLTEIDGMIGLSSVKIFVHDLVKQVRVEQKLSEKLGNQIKPNYHMIFTGPAGTGKTTVARLIAKLFYGLDILPRKTVNEVTKSDLVDKYVGGNERKTQEAIDNAMGGVLFIDEAYQLASEQGNGNAIIDTLLTNLENHRSEFVAIFAGYTSDMKRFLDMNEGLRSRIPRVIEFDAYTPEEVGLIVDDILVRNWVYDRELVREIATNNYEMTPIVERGNARWARTFAEQIVQKHKSWLGDHLETEEPLKMHAEIIESLRINN